MEEEGRQNRMDPDIFQAASSGDSSFFENLAKSNSSTLLKVTIEKNTVLHVALQFKRLEAAKKIATLWPSLVYETNSKGNTPLHVAARVGDSSMVNPPLAEAKKKDVETGGRQQLLSMVNQDGDTALHIAVRYGNFEVVKELIEEKDPAELAKQVNNAGESALFLAVDRQHYRIASHILRNAPDCSYAGRHGMNVFHALAFRKSSWPEVTLGRTSIFRTLHALKKSPEGFMKAVMRKCPSAIKNKDNSGWTPLEIAAFIGNEKFVKLLLEMDKFNIAYSKNNEGLSALHISAKEGNVKVMKELINKCPDIYELLDNKGRNALHVAAESGESAAVNFFLDRPEFNGLINEQDKEGNTPMHLAAIQEHFEIASQLLEHDKGSVDLNSTNNDGFTTMDNLMLLGFRLTRELRVKLKDAQQSLRGALLLKEMTGYRLNESDPTMKEALADPEVPADKSISDSKADSMENSDTKADGMKPSNSKADGMKNSKAESMMDSDTKADGMKNSISKADRMKNINSKAGRMKNINSKEDSIMKLANANMLVATLITTVTFTAAFTVPGGYRSQGVDEGTAVLSKTNTFHVFQMANTLAFGLSITSVFYSYARMTMNFLQPEDHKQLSLAFTTYSILSLVVAFVSGTYTVVPQSMGMTTAVVVCCCFFSNQILHLPEFLVLTCSGFKQNFAQEEKQEGDEDSTQNDYEDSSVRG